MSEDDDERFMREALAVARTGLGVGEMPIGAIVVVDHEVIAATREPTFRRRVTTLRRQRTFVAFSFEPLAILAPVCFHDDSNASTEEVHMKINSTNHQTPKQCAAAAGAAAESTALLD